MFKSDWKYSTNARLFDDVDSHLFENVHFKTVMSYIFGVWLFTILKVTFFVSDIYTCVKLLAYNSWSGDVIKPYPSFHISKWIFAGCILGSICLLIWEVVFGIKIYRTRNISLTYVNNFSRNAYSLSDYPKFCIFHKISSKGFFQKVAFFTFFEIKDCIRLLLTDTPRQVINGLTLWSVLVTVRDNSYLGDLESLSGLLNKIKEIAKSNHQEAVILSFMLFSFIVWLIFMAKLALALICSIYVYFRLIKDRRYASLREYVCVTVSNHVDDLVTKRTKNETATYLYRTS